MHPGVRAPIAKLSAAFMQNHDDLRDFRAADFVSDEEGTGLVPCAPSHGMDEYERIAKARQSGEVE